MPDKSVNSLRENVWSLGRHSIVNRGCVICAQANIWTGESSGKIVKNYSGVTTEEMMLSLWGILTFLFFVQVFFLSSIPCVMKACT